jgi:putative OPT family oligopeptide transporter
MAAKETTSSSLPVQPVVPASVSLPEITIKAVLLGIFLSVVLSGANAYLGLKAGMTVSASIPAAVISMAILRLFKNSNILENNIVQTAASAGESLAAGVIFTIPALVLLRAWSDFNYFETTMIAGLGGALGVLFTIPLRRALIVDSPLKFPEGVATAEVLKVGDEGAGISNIAIGALLGAAFKFGETAIRLWAGVLETAHRVGNSIAYFGSNASPALVAVGYIVGLNIAVLVFLGGALNWFIAIPIIASMEEWPAGMGAAEYAGQLWSTRTRYLGVGAMVVGGLWALIRLSGSLSRSIRASMAAGKAARLSGDTSVLRTERDTPMTVVAILALASMVPLYFVFEHATGNAGVAAVMAVIMMVAGFLFSAVASYMAGLVGSSNNPISGVTIATLLLSALLLLWMLGADDPAGPAAAIFIGAVVCCAAAIGGDNMQDLKAGQIVGATPYKQQIMQIIGVLAAALVMAPILSALLTAYGMGDIIVEGQEPMMAPQATLMMAVAKGVFAGNLPWMMIGIGAGIAVVIILIDLVLEAKNASFRMPVLAVAVGIYLPLELATPILLGGLVAFFVKRLWDSREAKAIDKSAFARTRATGERSGLLLAAGLITGEALLGILIALPLAYWEGTNKIAEWFGTVTGVTEPYVWPGLIWLAIIAGALYIAGLMRDPASSA